MARKELDLKKFDEEYVRLICTDGEVYEGLAGYNGEEFNELEFGRAEDGLKISYFLFYRGDIEDIKIVDEFANPYGKIEEEAVRDGFVIVEDILFDDDDVAAYRLLSCLRKYLDPDNEEKLKYEDDLLKALVRFRDFTKDEKARKLTEEILKMR
ncbi:MAG: hypothetical protein IJJ00_07845 [Erysipelotrichaceae bacterium]|nr:hypothetical protein [Erysipelotrichaceae bacterium]